VSGGIVGFGIERNSSVRRAGFALAFERGVLPRTARADPEVVDLGIDLAPMAVIDAARRRG
jgi:hypothetical protein